jgi:hypothetical protein
MVLEKEHGVQHHKKRAKSGRNLGRSDTGHPVAGSYMG